MPVSSRPRTLPSPSALASHWRHDPEVVFLNHGSFGSCPTKVLEVQHAIQERLQREPVRFFVELLEPLLDGALEAVGRFIGASPRDLAFVSNATEGVNTVIRSLRFEPGDELLTSSHEYNACNNALHWAAAQTGAKVVVADFPFPVTSARQVHEAITSRVTSRTKLVLLSHITSPSAVVLPVGSIIAELTARGVDTLLDSAHAPGTLDLNVEKLSPAYCTGNFHKWPCSPPGSAFLYVRPDRQERVRPVVISHGANSRREDRSRFRLEFDYTGSRDVSPWLATPAAIRFMEGLDPAGAGWPGIMRANHDLAIQGRDLLCAALNSAPSAPDEMTGCMAAVRIADPDPSAPRVETRYHDPLQNRLIDRWGIQVPINPIPGPGEPGRRYVRISAQRYNSLEQYAYLAEALVAEGCRLA